MVAQYIINPIGSLTGLGTVDVRAIAAGGAIAGSVAGGIVGGIIGVALPF
jgi:hypothetical protein